MKFGRLLVVILAAQLLLVSTTKANEKTDGDNSAKSESIEPVPLWTPRDQNKWSIRTGTESRRVYLRFPGSSELGTKPYLYDPDTNQSIFIAADKNGIGASLSVKSLWEGTEKENSYSDLRFYKFDDVWSYSVSWMQYNGFRLTVGEDVPNPSIATSKREDIKLKRFDGSVFYNLNPKKLSLPAILNGSAVQKISAGSFFITGSAANSKLQSTRGFIPYTNDSSACCRYKNDLDITSIAAGVLGVYNFVFDEAWLFGLGWGAEYGSEIIQQEINSSKSSESFYNNRYLLNFGYQAKDFFALIYFLENSQQVRIKNFNSLEIGSTLSQFTVGYYF